MEPWMVPKEWNAMGCGAYKSEFDCVSGLGQANANAAFQQHWQNFITEEDFIQMNSYGINTVRIPVGYWMLESLVYADSEHFPQGGFPYLERVVGWAKKYNTYVVLDLHGAPVSSSCLTHPARCK
jgi:glucan endo-1,6-beta-glucosidase